MIFGRNQAKIPLYLWMKNGILELPCEREFFGQWFSSSNDCWQPAIGYSSWYEEDINR